MLGRQAVLVRIVLVAVAALFVTVLKPVPPAFAETGAYSFPVVPGTVQWAQLKTHQDMVKATQLPARVADQMGTEQLVATVLDYPLLLDALAFNSVQRGIDMVASRFNGLAELLRRPDAGTALLARYRADDPHVSKLADEAAGDQTYAIWKIEMLLAQPQVLRTLSTAELEKLLRLGRDTFAVKQAESDSYGQAGLEPTAVLLGRALAVREGWDWQKTPLLRDAIAFEPSALASVLPAVDRHFAQPDRAHPTAGTGTGLLDHWGAVYTPKGSAVQVMVMTFELTKKQKKSLNKYVAKNYPNATRETDASRKYNCHSYAWYDQSTTNDVWINSPGDDTYWLDESYLEWRIPYMPFDDMKVSYASDDHSGIIDGYSWTARSKWGQLPRMYHNIDYSPYDSTTVNRYFPLF